MKRRGYFYVGFATTLNIILYALTFGRFIWLEARVRGGVFKNWGRRFRYRPRNFVQPATEEQIISLVKNSRSIRFFGAGHSFNDGVVSDDVLVSLDNYCGLVWKDLAKKQMCVKGGTRVRDVVKLLLKDGSRFRHSLHTTRKALPEFCPRTCTEREEIGDSSAKR
jgi:FAD/FMN-containing dehydrogenase